MLSLLDLTTRIANGELSPAAALSLQRDAIDGREDEIGAFAARPGSLDPGPMGPLAGIAVGIKDIVDTADLPTEHGCPAIYGGWQPRSDAAVVARLRRLGATLAGKTTTTAFAYLDPTATRNPAVPGHTPGGSSAGSAAAVAAGMVPLALGTQTGGSVIRPAAFCGVAAIKPSFRLIPTVGVKTYAWTLDTVGLFAASVPDLALGYALATGRSAAFERDRPVRFGVIRQDFAGLPEPEAETALAAGIAALRRVGASVVDIETTPAALAEAWSAHTTISRFEARQALAWEYETHRDRLPPLLRTELDEADRVSPIEYDDARRVARAARRQTRDLFAGVDALLTFAAPGAAPRGLGSTGEARFNRVWTMVGAPCVNVPGLRDTGGRPLGLQVIAAFGQDALALAAAERLERAFRMHDACG